MRAGDWASSVPEECVLEVRLAALPGEDLEAVQARFEAAVDAPCRVARLPGRTGSRSTREEPLFDVLGRAHAAVHGAPLEFLAFTGTTDARAFVVHDATPATCYGPIGGNLHAPDEWVDLESVRDTTLVLALAAEWCAADRPHRARVRGLRRADRHRRRFQAGRLPLRLDAVRREREGLHLRERRRGPQGRLRL